MTLDNLTNNSVTHRDMDGLGAKWFMLCPCYITKRRKNSLLLLLLPNDTDKQDRL